MDEIVQVFGVDLEYDFLSAWIKFNRLENHISQEALAYGICSTSYLSYFENGRKKLRPEIIEALLKRLNINEIKNIGQAGHVRQKFCNMLLQIESMDCKGAMLTYHEIIKTEDIISISPYNIEYRVYQLIYSAFVEKRNYSDLKKDLEILDEIYSSLKEDLQYLYMLVSGVIIYKHIDPAKGIERLTYAYQIKETPWVSYNMGVLYCYNNEPLKGLYYLERALSCYQESGHYINAIWCNNYIGICYSFLKIYDMAEKYFKAAITGAEHFCISEIIWSLYVNISNVYLQTRRYEESIKWIKTALETDYDPILPACNYIEVCQNMNTPEKYDEIFKKYLMEEYKSSQYYNFLYFLYLSIYHFNEDIFYEKTVNEILPYYEEKHSLEMCREIKMKLIEYLERKRRYKEANKIYKELV